MIKNENGYPFNVFISYRGAQGKIYADSIYSKLKYHNLRYQDQTIIPFFAPHDIHKGMNFEEALKETIPQIQCFIIVLTEDYFNDIKSTDKTDNMVKLELDSALNQEKLQFIPLIVENNYDYWENKSYFGQDFTPLQKRRFRRINPIYYSEDYFFDAERSLIPTLQEILKKNSCMESNFRAGRAALGQRIKNDRFLEIEGETQRLLEQQQLLQNFDLPTYIKVFKRKPQYILDVGCNDGSALIQRLQKAKYEQYEKIIGLDISEDLVNIATKKYADNAKIKYYLADVESRDFSTVIRRIMQENDIAYFDFINISSVLLQLEDPFAFLLTIDEIINPNNGQILVVDIDDGLALAYPDPNQTFSRVFDICNRCEMTGFRKTGRQIFTLLSKATDCKKISFEKSGLNTSNMSKSERRIFYDVVFQFIGAALKKELHENPNAIDLQLEAEWFAAHKNQIRDEFFNNDFFFSFGYVIFLAQK